MIDNLNSLITVSLLIPIHSIVLVSNPLFKSRIGLIDRRTFIRIPPAGYIVG